MAFKHKDLVGSVGLAAKGDEEGCPLPVSLATPGTAACPEDPDERPCTPPTLEKTNTCRDPDEEPCPPPTLKNPTDGCYPDRGYRQAADLALLQDQLRHTLAQGS
jgi:hypothetical protein